LFEDFGMLAAPTSNRIDEEQDAIRTLNGLNGSLNALVFDLIVRRTDPCAVDESHRPTIDAGRFGEDVTRRACLLVHYGARVAEQAIKEATFSDIGWAAEDHLPWLQEMQP
jgi:hypothetical protein